MPKILFISKSLDSPSARYRIGQFLPLAIASGWTVEHLAWHSSLKCQRNMMNAAKKAAVTVVSRCTFNPLTRYWLRHSARRLVLDLDDAIFLIPIGKRRSSRPRSFAAMATKCDEIWTGNDYLAQHARQFNDHVEILPTSIDPQKYLEQAPKDPNWVDLVWVGSSSTRSYLESALTIFHEVARQVPQLRLKVISDFQLQGDIPIINIPWTPDGEMRAIAGSAIGVAPMPDDPWTRGKCGCKVLQYMAASLPVVVSDMPTHRRMIRNHQEGFLVANTEQWVTAIGQLAANQALRTQMGHAGRLRLMSDFSLEATWEKMHQRLTNLIQ